VLVAMAAFVVGTAACAIALAATALLPASGRADRHWPRSPFTRHPPGLQGAVGDLA
jgi:hypothetical protein